MRFETTKIKVCTVCIHLMANGEYNDGEDTAQRCAERQDLVWGGNQKYFTPGSDCDDECRYAADPVLYPEHECDTIDQGFSWSSCDGCEEALGGDRFLAYVMIPVPTCAEVDRLRGKMEKARDGRAGNVLSLEHNRRFDDSLVAFREAHTNHKLYAKCIMSH